MNVDYGKKEPKDLTEIEINRDHRKALRIKSFIDQTGDPYRLRYGKAIIDVEYTPGAETLQERIKECCVDEVIL